MIPSIIIISFILENIVSNIIPVNTTLFNVCFVPISLIIIYPYFNKFNNKYLVTCFITGLCYDLIFTSTLFFYAIIFLVIGVVIKYICNRLSINTISISILSIIVILLYIVFVYFVLVVINYFKYDFNYLLKSIYSSIILNVIYAIIIYLITDYISKKLKIQKKI